MKKLIVLLLIAFLGVNVQSFSQAVDDRAVVPVAVTLNSILRLNIKSGGNIEFNFNTLQQYQDGIANSEAYDTKLTVASSTNWDLEMYAEDASLMGTDSIGGSTNMDLGYIAYEVTYDGSGDIGDYTITSSGTPQQLNGVAGTEIIEYDGTASNAGDVQKNAFTVNWECGTGNTAGDLLSAQIAADRYSTNVFFILKPAD